LRLSATQSDNMYACNEFMYYTCICNSMHAHSCVVCMNACYAHVCGCVIRNPSNNDHFSFPPLISMWMWMWMC
jgi:hypothetical protein